MSSYFVELHTVCNGKEFLATQLLAEDKDTFLWGAPGSGKTTLAKRMTENVDPSFSAVLPARDFLVWEHDLLLGLEQFGSCGPNSVSTLLHENLANLGALAEAKIFVDGLDELETSLKFKLIECVSEWREAYPKVSWVITSRPDQTLEPPLGFRSAYISPLSEEGIRTIGAHLGLTDRHLDLLIDAGPFASLSETPLFALLLCKVLAVYGDVPISRRSVFDKYVNTIAFEWDESKNIRREGLSAEMLISVLEEVALEIWRRGTVLLSYQDFMGIMSGKLALSAEQSSIFLRDSRVETFLQSEGLDFGFVHRSIQEYFTARALSNLPNFTAELSRTTLRPEIVSWLIDLTARPAELAVHLIEVGFSGLVYQYFAEYADHKNRIAVECIDLLAKRLGYTKNKSDETVIEISQQVRQINHRAAKYAAILNEQNVKTKGKKFEEYVRGILEEGFDIVSVNQMSNYGEFDIVFVVREYDPYWDRFPSDFYIECKNLSDKSPVGDLNEFFGKASMLRAKLGFVFSMSGFTNVALKSAHASWRIDTQPSIACISGEDLRTWSEGEEDVHTFLKRMCRRTDLGFD